ncbi:unnamed protein product [Caenorhabditis sp. 36 PRJEB53466]|nr:unnamed protein product [Caenorhabditis sp. 36 PRJEB53466]
MLYIRRILLPHVPSTSSKSPFLLNFRWIHNRNELGRTRRFSTVPDHFQDNLQKFVKVATTGYSFLDSDGKRIAKYGIYWGKDDPRNGIRTLPAGQSHVAAGLTAILEAINVAREEDPPPPLMIYSDYELCETLLRDLSGWAKRDFYQRNHELKLKNAAVLSDLFLAVQGLQLKIVYKQSRDADSSKNRVATAIMEGIQKKIDANLDRIRREGDEKGKKEYCRAENPVELGMRIDDVAGAEEGMMADKEGRTVTGRRTDWSEVYVAAKCDTRDGGFACGKERHENAVVKVDYVY